MRKYDGLRNANPNRVPVLLTANKAAADALNLRFKRMLVDTDMPYGAFLNKLRSGSAIQPRDSLCVLLNTHGGPIIPTPSETMGQLDTKYANGDGALHATYSVESTFG